MRDFEIITHLNTSGEEKNPRAPPGPPPKYTKPIKIVPYDDGWPEYDEPV